MPRRLRFSVISVRNLLTTYVDAAARDGQVDARNEGPDKARRSKQLARLADIEAKVNHLIVPLSYADELYTLKLHSARAGRARAFLNGSSNTRHRLFGSVDRSTCRCLSPR